MPTIIVYDHDVINAVQPEVSAVKVGTSRSLFVDANLNQYTDSDALAVSCSDVNELTLWTLTPDEIGDLFVDAGATEPTDGFTKGAIWQNVTGDKLIFYAIGTVTVLPSSDRYIYLGVAPISDTGVVAPPVLTNYLRMRLPDANLYTAVGVWEKRFGDEPSSVLIMTWDVASGKVQWHVCPSVADIEAGTYKGAHAGCTGTLASDQGPGLVSKWTNSTAEQVGYEFLHDGTVRDNWLGFLADDTFYFLVPRAWMEAVGDNGFADNWSDERPLGGVFTVALGVGEYATHTWPAGQNQETVTVATDAEDVTESAFTPTLPWAEEYTRIYDGAANGGWLATYGARPAIFYGADGLPVLLFTIIDGNSTYEDDVGQGERIFYAKVRGYKWTGSVFALFDTAEGIVLRQGDLGFSGYNFDDPDSQNIFLIDGDIYFQICQWREMGTVDNTRSILTRFGRFIESETRTSNAFGRVRYVRRT